MESDDSDISDPDPFGFDSAVEEAEGEVAAANHDFFDVFEDDYNQVPDHAALVAAVPDDCEPPAKTNRATTDFGRGRHGGPAERSLLSKHMNLQKMRRKINDHSQRTAKTLCEFAAAVGLMGKSARGSSNRATLAVSTGRKRQRHHSKDTHHLQVAKY